MKKKWLVTIGVILAFGICATVAFAFTPMKLFVNGLEIKPDVPPQIINGRTMVPVRWVAEALGADVDWNIGSQTVKITSQGRNTDESPVTLTLDEIKKKYTGTTISSIHHIGKEHLLVESRKNTCANKFDLYDLKTGDVDILPTMPEFVTLEKIENENYFIFLSSGKNSESSIGTFPYLIKCIRIKTDLNESDDFISLSEDKYFSLEESIQSGSKNECLMSDVNVTFEGLEVLFKPIGGKELQFYAAATDIPPTKTSYDKDKKQMTLEIEASQLNEKLKSTQKVNMDDNQYISSYGLNQKDDKIYLTIDVKDLTKQYTIKMKRLPEGQLPYFSVIFRENI